MKKENKKPKGFSKDREFSVILEKIYAEIKAITENQRAFSDKLDKTINTVTKNSEDITMLNLKFIGVKDEIAGIKGDITNMKGDIVGIKGDITKMKGDIVGIKGDITKINETITDIKEDIRIIKTDFGNRLTRLESSVK